MYKTNNVNKNLISKIFIVFILLLSITLCWNKDNQIEEAKKNMWIIESDSWMEEDTWTNIEEEQTSSWANDEEVQAQDSVIMKPLTQDQFLTLDDISENDFKDGELEIKWNTTTKVDKIIVTFENADSDFPKDVYTLNQFKPWDKTFMYRAFSRYQTLDYWKNVYTIEAYSWDNISKLELVLNLEKDEENNQESKVEKITEKLTSDWLPMNSKYWNLIELWDWKVGYSDIKGLDIKKISVEDMTCENANQNLWQIIDWWYYWNTCRPINTDKWISFYIIRLEWSKYFYEKHYYIADKWLYGSIELETWEWIDKTNLKEKNLELKEKNTDYTITDITDSLFKDISN